MFLSISIIITRLLSPACGTYTKYYSLSVLALATTFNSTFSGYFQWISGPVNVHVQVGETAIFPCNFTGSHAYPWWVVNNRTYYYRQVPPRHFYQKRALYVYDVDMVDNLTQYQCAVSDGNWIVSTIGVLYIAETGEDFFKSSCQKLGGYFRRHGAHASWYSLS